ncbi:MAG: tRNA (guanine-N(1)-)-methyltransferase [Chlamydiia bacterium]|nr:tRNA (guanine-N(1)-)-methyltransferase [Chlamydiia bacterium]MCH9617960.1 tRNA (guanine-N(1)-)-methyltransferase [Chlamydiia bacterium]MCH9623715.1 tRNA (guanine-N(1)-)-methyltransferase [Chlamydiia bacterium]
MKITILSLFPEFFKSMLETSMLKRAVEKGVIELELVNIRDFGEGKHKVVDDKPFGGGPGMLMKPEPVIKAIDSVRTDDSHVIFFSPGGELLRAKKCERLAKTHKHLILLCGHYEGIDQRIIDLAVDEEISIGDYVLTSGMIPALVLLDGTLRFLEDGVGNSDSVYGDTFHLNEGLKGPQYTRPAVFNELEVPKVLQSGNHKEIALWRKKAGAERTLKREQIKTRMA